MKKILAVALTLILALAASGSLAEGVPSINVTMIEKVSTDIPEVVIVKTEDTPATEEIKETLMALGSENTLSLIPEEVASMIPEEFTSVNEISTQKVEGDISTVEEITVVYTFTVPYAADEKVYLLIGIPMEDGTVEWILLEGQTNEAGDVVVTYDKEMLAKLGSKEFLVVVINKK